MRTDGQSGMMKLALFAINANKFSLPKIIDHFSTGKIQATSYVDPAQHDKRHMDKITVVPNSFCQGRTHL
jgi:hypothetical protein